MHLIRRNLRKIFVVTGLFLLIFAFTGCRDEHIFRQGITVPSPLGSSFVVLGDSRSGDWIYQNIVGSIVSSLSFATCMIHTGDMIDNPGNLGEWNYFLSMTAPLAAVMPWYGTVGNHDVDSLASQQLYQDLMNFPGNELYYSFDVLDSHFIVLDTEIPGQTGWITGQQLTWLKQDLQTHAASAQYVFAFTHRPVYPQGHYLGSDLSNADELHQLFVQYGVDIVFSGHEHQYYMYQKAPVYYVVTGGAGAPIHKGGIGKSFHHYLLVELLPPKDILVHVLDTYAREIQTDVAVVNANL